MNIQKSEQPSIAFLLKEQSLQYLQDRITDIYPKSTISAYIKLKNAMSFTTNEITKIEKISTDNTSPISEFTVTISCSSDEYIRISFGDENILYQISYQISIDEKHIKEVEQILQSFLTQIKPWYSRIATINFFLVFFTLYSIFIFLSVIIVDVLESYIPEIKKQIRELSIPFSLINFYSFVALVILNTTKKYIFPIGLFCFGYNSEEHKKKRNYTKYYNSRDCHWNSDFSNRKLCLWISCQLIHEHRHCFNFRRLQLNTGKRSTRLQLNHRVVAIGNARAVLLACVVEDFDLRHEAGPRIRDWRHRERHLHRARRHTTRQQNQACQGTFCDLFHRVSIIRIDLSASGSTQTPNLNSQVSCRIDAFGEAIPLPSRLPAPQCFMNGCFVGSIGEPGTYPLDRDGVVDLHVFQALLDLIAESDFVGSVALEQVQISLEGDNRIHRSPRQPTLKLVHDHAAGIHQIASLTKVVTRPLSDR